VNKTVLLALGWLLTSSALGETPHSCPQTMAGRKFCLSGEMMLCNKEFDPKINDFVYEWHAINDTGQTFDVFSPYYKKLSGYTPLACSTSKNEVVH
jgi:hypothetical protein